MKKIFAIVLVAVSLSANAFFSSSDMPWNSGSNNNGYQKDNGMFGYNPYNYWDPRWYMEEMSNMVDEFDDNLSSNDNNNNGYNPYNNASNAWNTQAPTMPNMQTPTR
ncbi:hypothetical protein [Candidatus Thioglobus sp.]|uniref:hypothetical protein n=1 Tax=Candidatus Thioglobus sp. TaxID=2026721 RepID=UPI003D0E460A